jgi:hypothetical protein
MKSGGECWKSEHFEVYCAGRASERNAVLEIARAVVTVATDQHGGYCPKGQLDLELR